MDKVTYCAVNGITEEEYDAIGEALRQAPGSEVSPKVRDVLQSVLYGAGYQGTVRSQSARVGAARKPPLACTHR